MNAANPSSPRPAAPGSETGAPAGVVPSILCAPAVAMSTVSFSSRIANSSVVVYGRMTISHVRAPSASCCSWSSSTTGTMQPERLRTNVTRVVSSSVASPVDR